MHLVGGEGGGGGRWVGGRREEEVTRNVCIVRSVSGLEVPGVQPGLAGCRQTSVS